MSAEVYSETVLGRFLAPAHAGPLPTGAHVLDGRATAAGGASLALYLSLNAAGTVERAVFRALACPSGIAAADWACEWLHGRTLADAGGLTAGAVEAGAGLDPGKRDCGLLVEDAIAAAMAKLEIDTCDETS